MSCMTQFDQLCDRVVRAGYQISALTEDRVEYDAINDVVPLTKDEFARVILALEPSGLIRPGIGNEGIALTLKGLEYAAALAPLSEPSLFQDI